MSPPFVISLYIFHVCIYIFSLCSRSAHEFLYFYTSSRRFTAEKIARTEALVMLELTPTP